MDDLWLRAPGLARVALALWTLPCLAPSLSDVPLVLGPLPHLAGVLTGLCDVTLVLGLLPRLAVALPGLCDVTLVLGLLPRLAGVLSGLGDVALVLGLLLCLAGVAAGVGNVASVLGLLSPSDFHPFPESRHSVVIVKKEKKRINIKSQKIELRVFFCSKPLALQDPCAPLAKSVHSTMYTWCCTQVMTA